MRPHLPYLPTWQRRLAQERGAAQADAIAAEIRQRYAALAAQPPPFVQPQQTARLRKLILPGLALYQTLQGYHASQESCLAETGRLFEVALFRNERRFAAWINRLPDPFPAVRWLLRRIERTSHAEAQQVLVEDSPRAFAFDAQECFILEALRFYGAPELTVLYCKTDDWIAQAMPKIRWRRTRTLAGGAAACDFRWERGG